MFSTLKSSVNENATDFRVTDPKTPVKLLENIGDDSSLSINPITIPDAFNHTVQKFPDNKALMFKDEASNEWKGITFKEYKDRVFHISKVFIKLGLEKHGTVAVLAFNCVEWFISELAAIHAG
jgi:long-chain-fatty-acid--CoA ligase ACSBG